MTEMIKETLIMDKFADLKGKTLINAENIANRELIFTLDDGSKCKLYHDQKCCESVFIEDIIGDLDDIIGSPILMAEEVTGQDTPEDSKIDFQLDSFTWTFYKLATLKGYVTIRWYGESTGYYSERVNFTYMRGTIPSHQKPS
jgi:hypothetical protein